MFKAECLFQSTTFAKINTIGANSLKCFRKIYSVFERNLGELAPEREIKFCNAD